MYYLGSLALEGLDPVLGATKKKGAQMMKSELRYGIAYRTGYINVSYRVEACRVFKVENVTAG